VILPRRAHPSSALATSATLPWTARAGARTVLAALAALLALAGCGGGGSAAVAGGSPSPSGTGGASAPSASPSTPAPRPAVRRVAPVDAAGRLLPAYRVTARVGGAQCLAGSIAIGAGYRCFAHDGIYDPCWRAAAPSGATPRVVCLREPWDHVVTELSVSRGFMGAPGGPAGHPWGVRTASGARCGFAQGASGMVAGRRIDFVCSRHLVLAGPLEQSADGWRIRRAVAAGGYSYSPAGWARLTTVWVGVTP
jgi:hypothetical protein